MVALVQPAQSVKRTEGKQKLVTRGETSATPSFQSAAPSPGPAQGSVQTERWAPDARHH